MVRLGGAEGIRTPDLRSAIAALSQLSYGPAAGTNRPNSGEGARNTFPVSLIVS